MQKIGDIIQKYIPGDTDKRSLSFGTHDKYVSREFQKYAYDLALELNDLPHKSLYMKLAKTTSRGLMESARSFVKDAANARSKGRLFMWKLKQLKEDVKITQGTKKNDSKS
ncbi:MAG TPA: hypothetical protein VKC54_00710 [Patescibacteria group bacterium]|nr:hypothetical protein [Patescibacteria group bacterium]